MPLVDSMKAAYPKLDPVVIETTVKEELDALVKAGSKRDDIQVADTASLLDRIKGRLDDAGKPKGLIRKIKEKVLGKSKPKPKAKLKKKAKG